MKISIRKLDSGIPSLLVRCVTNNFSFISDRSCQRFEMHGIRIDMSFLAYVIYS